MKLEALLDVQVVAHEAPDEVNVLLDLQAPEMVTTGTRPPAVLQVVLDRSGSMAGAPLEGAKRALAALVQKLAPGDLFGLVTFDDEAQVVVPLARVADKDRIVASIASVRAGGTTDLGAGYMRGLRELRRASSGDGARSTVLVVSDGHVNAGIRDADEFGGLAARAYAAGVVTSSLGYGGGYDETLLAALARSGNGNHVFAADPDAAGAAIAAEVDGLLDKVAQGVSLTVTFEPEVAMLALHNDLPAHQVGPGQVMVEIGDLYAEEARKLLLTLQVPAMAALGLAQVATLQLQYVELPAVVEHTISLPITVNVVPGDEAAGRVPDPAVHSELLFQKAQAAKRQASEAFEHGDRATGRAMLDDALMSIAQSRSIAPAPAIQAILAEEADLTDMATMTDAAADASYLSKRSRESYHRQNRKRGRRSEEGR